uniref:Uncharacterized protein n=1 Tax=Leersia perrieri TaxID=77586 RepID=A0A0D9XS89_9ORYZ
MWYVWPSDAASDARLRSANGPRPTPRGLRSRPEATRRRVDPASDAEHPASDQRHSAVVAPDSFCTIAALLKILCLVLPVV